MRRRPPAAAQGTTALWAPPQAASGPISASYTLIGALLLLAGGAWGVSALRMAGMDAGPGADPGALGFYLTTWLVMMTAMMLPSLAPVVLAHRELHRQRAPGGYTRAGALLLIGYLAVWATAGVAGYAVLEAGRSLDGGLLAWGSGGRWTAAAVLLVAAVYELTASKQACLARCRTPGSSLREHWHGGRYGALRMGARHGVVCLGCCWALMAALFALGVMSLVWMSLISLVIAAQKLLPWRALAVAAAASILVALAVGVGATPAQVPGLTIPGSTKAMRAMGTARRHAMGVSAPHGMGTTAPKAMGRAPSR